VVYSLLKADPRPWHGGTTEVGARG
jgi:hypothetical protein